MHMMKESRRKVEEERMQKEKRTYREKVIGGLNAQTIKWNTAYETRLA